MLHRSIRLNQALMSVAIGIWIVSPIVGTIFLLISLQIIGMSQISKKSYNSLTNLVFIVVCLTLSVFFASIKPTYNLDTYNYIQEYQLCGRVSFSECLFSTPSPAPMEPGFYLFAHPVFSLTGGSNIAFLLFWSLLTNFIVFFLICKPLSSKYAPLIGLMIISSIFFYTQTYEMRQFLSIAMVLAGIVNISNVYVSIFLFFFACLNHFTAFLYLPLIYLDFNWVKKIVSEKIWYVAIGVIAASVIIYQFLLDFDLLKTIMISLLELNQEGGVMSNKTDHFLNNEDALDGKGSLVPNIVAIAIGFAYICFNLTVKPQQGNRVGAILSKIAPGERTPVVNNTIMAIVLREKIFNDDERIDRALMYIYSFQLLIAVVTINFGYINQRLCKMIFIFTGVFLYPMLRKIERNIPQRVFIIGYLIFSLLYLAYFLQLLNTPEGTMYEFMGGKVLGSSLIDYITFTFEKWSKSY
jgi:hypothetical protein